MFVCVSYGGWGTRAFTHAVKMRSAHVLAACISPCNLASYALTNIMCAQNPTIEKKQRLSNAVQNAAAASAVSANNDNGNEIQGG